MSRLVRHRLNVSDSARLFDFYCRILGMRRFGDSGALLGFDETQCLLELQDGAGRPCPAGPAEVYWKIGITLRNLDEAVAHLRREGWPVSDPVQFADIGYLCHLRDPDGFIIELLQQGFEGRHGTVGDGHPIGGQATLAHLTFRINDLAAARAMFEGELAMRLLSVQPVRAHGFCLYFYAWSDEALPNEGLEAVANREWLWARPYTLIELQHLESPDARIRTPGKGEAGFAGFGYTEAATGAVTWVPLDRLIQLVR